MMDTVDICVHVCVCVCYNENNPTPDEITTKFFNYRWYSLYVRK